MVCREVADTLVLKHQAACKRANSHCIYSQEIYEGSCIKCFALWWLNAYVKPGEDNNELADKLIAEHKAECRQIQKRCIYADKTYKEDCIECFILWLQATEKLNPHT